MTVTKPLIDLIAQRDHARSVAVALEAECVVLRGALVRIRNDDLVTGEEILAVCDDFPPLGPPVLAHQMIAAAALARTDPLRDT